MTRKPTYAELENRIRELEQKESEHKRMEASLRESQEILRVFVKNTPAAVAMCDRQMRYVACSDRWVHDYGLSYGDLIGMCHYDVFPDLPSHWKKEHKRCFSGDVIINEEEPFPRADGSLDWVRRNLHPWLRKSGQIGGLIMFTEVITERKQAEDALRKSEEKYRHLFESALVGIYRTRIEDGKFLDANKSLAKMMGYESLETFLNEFITTEHYANPKRREELFEWLKKSPTVDGYEIEMLRKDGTVINIALSATIYPERGYTEGFIVDITARMEAQKSLREVYDIINRSPAVAFLWKNADNWPVEYVSDNVEELLGYSVDDLISGKVAYSEVIHPDDLERVSKEVARFSTQKDRERFTHDPYRIISKQGELRWVSDRTFIRKNAQGEITHYQGVIIDTTKRKIAENELIVERNRLQEALSEIKTLSGLLPICASCKKIRDDKGYWSRIESYISRHTEAIFSHGICPECRDAMYGQEDWYKRRRKK